ncbi:hypothetical protein [Streptomyces sp. ITFR-16]|uniref:hypothetical protein n=1 Tax=Streptomyces sp. ITFR-16 TaxID=3075198 RepID=UPI0028895DBE|nr:hypothetical protein [Streptomyces sp. ITFR-16]WNI23860.1 hypothetical protein RLT58_18925 [Streptomyces sp. ITFR-16]
MRRPFRRGSAEDARPEGEPVISSGKLEVAELENNPADPLRAQALATALGVRAALDGEFRALLDEWWQDVRSSGSSEVHNSISGGTQNSPVLQGRDFFSPTFNSSSEKTAADGQGDTPPA